MSSYYEFNTNNLENKNYLYNQPPAENGLINCVLPMEIFSRIFSYVEEIKPATFVCKYWIDVSIDCAKRNDLFFKKEFMNFLDEKSKKEGLCAGQIASINQIWMSYKILESANLVEIKKLSFELEEEILKVLKNCKEEDLTLLDNLHEEKVKSAGFEKIFFLANIYRRVDETDEMTDDERSQSLREIAVYSQLLPYGEFNRAIEIAHKIPDHSTRRRALKSISKELAKKDRVDEAIQTAKIIDDDNEMRETALADISWVLAGKGKIEKAIEIANKIDDRWRSAAFYMISKQLTRKGEFDRAIEFAQMISNDFIRESAFEIVNEPIPIL